MNNSDAWATAFFPHDSAHHCRYEAESSIYSRLGQGSHVRRLGPEFATGDGYEGDSRQDDERNVEVESEGGSVVRAGNTARMPAEKLTAPCRSRQTKRLPPLPLYAQAKINQPVQLESGCHFDRWITFGMQGRRAHLLLCRLQRFGQPILQ